MDKMQAEPSTLIYSLMKRQVEPQVNKNLASEFA